MTRFELLWEKYLAGRLTAAEVQELQQLLLQEDKQVPAAIDELLNSPLISGVTEVERKALIFSRVMEQVRQRPVRRLVVLKRMVAAAVLLLAVGAGSYFFFLRKTPSQPIVVTPKPATDVSAPAAARAVLTLSDGRQIILDSAGNGTLATQGPASIVKLADGQLAYTAKSAISNQQSEIFFNTLFNPRGSKIVSILLSDGTRVWLNNESSIRYPVAFTGKERKVDITGEVYFEVAHNATMPFTVSKGTMQVQVLGTRFNVNAYDDEGAVRVTLLEGSVRVKSDAGGTKHEAIIKPGEQAVLTTNPARSGTGNKLQTTNNIDLEQVMAWKDGLFRFRTMNIQAIMRQAARWYNIDNVIYEGNTAALNFSGVVSRKEHVSQLLNVLEGTGTVHFRIEGQTIRVQP